MIEVIYKITVESFKWKNEVYNVAISPDLYADVDGIEFSGSYTGLLIDPNRGTIQFTMSPDEIGYWDVEPKGKIDPNVIDEIEKIIARIEDGTSRQF